jgi:glycosyltransferase involved in cell wall biosynthesis
LTRRCTDEAFVGVPGHDQRADGPMGRPLTVGIVAPPWLPVPPEAYGGTENVLDVLARGIQAAGHRVVLFTTGDATCPVERCWTYEQSLGIGAGGGVGEARHVVEAYQALADVDVIHDHTIVGPLYAAGLDLPPVVTTNHGPFNRELLPIYRAIAGRVGVIAISEHQASTAVEVPLAAVIHHGLDVDRIPVGSGTGGYALFLGRMHPSKGIPTAIAAARRAGMPLRIAAKMTEPAERHYYETVIAPLLGGDITMVGEVGGAAKWELLGGACCLLNPVQWPEPFGMVVAEALACGTPVVASDCGSMPELIDHARTGFVCHDDEQLVAALGSVGSLRRDACRRSAEQRFSVQRMVSEHLACYRRAIAAHGRDRSTEISDNLLAGAASVAAPALVATPSWNSFRHGVAAAPPLAVNGSGLV